MYPTYVLVKEGDPRPCIADVVWFHEPFNAFVITRINVPDPIRGRGHGTELLELVLADADEEGARLMLAPEASGGLPQRELEKWYSRHGFGRTHSGAMMERSPR